MSGQAGNETPGFSARETMPDPDTRHAHSARAYNYWLGGKDNFAADQEAAEQAIAANPGIVADVRANRAFLVRAVRYLASECGIRQFLDVGAGLPTASNTHQVALGRPGFFGGPCLPNVINLPCFPAARSSFPHILSVECTCRRSAAAQCYTSQPIPGSRALRHRSRATALPSR